MPATHAYAGIGAGRYINAKFEGHTYLEYLNFLRKSDCQRQIIGANVRVVFDPVTWHISIRLYDTDIITYVSNDTFWANTQGWVTMTTVTRMNQFGPLGVRFWRHENEVWCSRGPIGPWHIYPIEKPDSAVEYVEPTHPICPDPHKRRRRTIRTRSLL